MDDSHSISIFYFVLLHAMFWISLSNKKTKWTSTTVCDEWLVVASAQLLIDWIRNIVWQRLFTVSVHLWRPRKMCIEVGRKFLQILASLGKGWVSESCGNLLYFRRWVKLSTIAVIYTYRLVLYRCYLKFTCAGAAWTHLCQWYVRSTQHTL